MKYKNDSKHEHYNIQQELITNLAEQLFYLEQLLSEAYNGRSKAYRESLGKVIGLKNKIKSLKLWYNKEVEYYLVK